MRELNTTSAAWTRFRTMALATALACVSNGAFASFASSVIDGIFVSGTAAPGSFLFTPTDRVQSWDLNVFENGVLQQNASGLFPDWENRDDTASSAQAQASISTTTSDFGGGLITPSFSLSASASHLSNGVLYDALGLGFLSGSFCFWDSNTDFDGTTASCTGSGDLSLQVFYTLMTETSFPGPDNFGYADIALDASGGTGGVFFGFDTASTLPGFPSSHSGSFQFDTTLSANGPLNFSVTGTVQAQTIPEPGILSLAALGLIGLVAARRRSARAVS